MSSSSLFRSLSPLSTVLLFVMICVVITLYGFHLFKAKARQLVDQEITVIPVIIGDKVNKEHVEPVTDDEDRIVPVKPTDKPEDVTDTVDEKIKEAIKGKLHNISR